MQGTDSKNKKIRSKNHVRGCNGAEKSRPSKGTFRFPIKCSCQISPYQLNLERSHARNKFKNLEKLEKSTENVFLFQGCEGVKWS